jgi:hypothetical protein
MSDHPDTQTKLDVIIAQLATLATLATRDEVAAIRAEITDIRADIAEIRAIMATRDEVAEIGATMATRDDLAKLRTSLRDELTEVRVAVMARIDRLQDAFTMLHEERIVDIGSAERAERMAKAAQEDASAIGNIVTPLIRLVHGMRTQLDDLAEQVRVLKEGRAA